jgi:putative tricarboxylic transport membrane protein
VFGLLGMMMRRFAFPVLPLILGVILGPLMETNFREALAISGGDTSGLFNEPLAVVVYAIAALAVLAPLVLRRVRPASEEPTKTEQMSLR